MGFRVVLTSDPARPFDSGARPVPLSVWYPAASGTAGTLGQPFGAYVLLYTPAPARLAAGLTAADSATAPEAYRAHWFPDVPSAAVDALLAVPTPAHRDAEPASGSFPLVVYAPGLGGSPLTHTPTGEYLASHGYVVVMVPSQGPTAAGMPFDAAGLDEQARDLSLALGTAARWPGVDAGRAAAAGFSFGGGAAVVAAARDPRVRAAVSIDGVAQWQTTIPRVRAAAGYAAGRVRAPLLALGNAADPYEDAGVFDDQPLAGRTLVRLAGTGHHTFIAGPQIAAVVGRAEPAGARARYAAATAVLRAFLDAHLAGRPAAWRALVAVNASGPPRTAAGAPHHVASDAACAGAGTTDASVAPVIASVVHRAALEAPARATFLADLARAAATARATAVQRTLLRRDPRARLASEAELGLVADRLDEEQRPADALLVRTLTAEVYATPTAFNDLAGAERAAGHPAAARRAWRRALAADARNVEARRALRGDDP